jgi:hypothetical protein
MNTALAELARQVRGDTLQFLGLPRPWLTWSPTGTANHILWHAGHALWLQDALTIEPLIGQSELPAGWADRFAQESQPALVVDWPESAEVLSRLERQLERILHLLSQREEFILAHAHDSPRGGWPLLAGMIHGWHDEARHQGEMYLLFKLCRARSTSGGTP